MNFPATTYQVATNMTLNVPELGFFAFFYFCKGL